MNRHRDRWAWLRSDNLRAVLGIAMIAAVIYSVWHSNEVTNCQTEWQNRTNEVINDRSDGTDNWMVSQLAYLDIVAEQGDPAQRLTALNEYRAGLRGALTKRKSAPLPEEPRCR